jgi:mRNA interferase MazF
MTYTKSSDVITVNVPGVTGVKRRPAVVLSSNKYHNIRPDVIVGLITSQTKRVGTTDYVLQDWQAAVVGWVKRSGTQHKIRLW